MTFNTLFILLFIFVLIPGLIKKLQLNVDERVQKWLDINQLLELAFCKVPKFQYSAQVSFILGIIFTYLSLNFDSTFSLIAYILSLVFFVYLAYLYSDNLWQLPELHRQIIHLSVYYSPEY